MSTTPTRLERRRDFAARYLKHAVAPITSIDRPVKLTARGGPVVVGVTEDAPDYSELLPFWQHEANERA